MTSARTPITMPTIAPTGRGGLLDVDTELDDTPVSAATSEPEIKAEADGLDFVAVALGVEPAEAVDFTIDGAVLDDTGV